MCVGAEGLRVLTAADGVEALRVADHETPAIVLTDLMMPRLDGYDLIDCLRATHSPAPGIIAMSAVPRLAERPPAADRIIAKPFDLDEMLASVDVLLGMPAVPGS